MKEDNKKENEVINTIGKVFSIAVTVFIIVLSIYALIGYLMM